MAGSMESAASMSLLDLPNEVLLQVLITLSTRDLLLLTAVSHRFHALSLRILYHRLTIAANLSGDHTLLLECYPPSARLTEPPLFCRYLGTKGLDDHEFEREYNQNSSLWGEEQFARLDTKSPAERMRDLRGFYSSFKPHRKQVVERRYRHPAGDIPGSRTYAMSTRAAQPAQDQNGQSTSSQPSSLRSASSPYQQAPPLTPSQSNASTASTASTASSSTMRSSSSSSSVTTQTTATTVTPTVSHDDPPEPPVEKPVSQLINLDSSELFAQLCALTTLVKVGPKNGLFLSSVGISEGILRIWRDWLAEQSAEPTQVTLELEQLQGDNGRGKARANQSSDSKAAFLEDEDEIEKQRATAREFGNSVQPQDRPSILWVNDGHKNVGVRFSVQERKWRPQSRFAQHGEPILAHRDEELPVSYEIIYEELLIRTTHLLLATETSITQQASVSGKAIVFGAWA